MHGIDPSLDGSDLSGLFNLGLNHLDALEEYQKIALLDVILYFAIGTRPLHKVAHMPLPDPDSAFAAASSLRWLVTLLGNDTEYASLDLALRDYYERAQPALKDFKLFNSFNSLNIPDNEVNALELMFGYRPTIRTGSRYRPDYHPANLSQVDDEWFFTRSMPLEMAVSMQNALANLFGIIPGPALASKMEYFHSNLEQSLLNPGFYRIVIHRADIYLGIEKLSRLLSDDEKSASRTIDYDYNSGKYSADNIWGEAATTQLRTAMRDQATFYATTAPSKEPPSVAASCILMTKNVTDEKKTKDPDDPINQAKAGIKDCQDKLRFMRALHIIRLIKQFSDIAAPIATTFFGSFPFETGPYLVRQIQATADDVQVMAYTLEKLFSHKDIANLYNAITQSLPKEAHEAPVVVNADLAISLAAAAVHGAEEHLKEVKAAAVVQARIRAITGTGVTAGTAVQVAPFLETAAAPSASSTPPAPAS